MTQDVYRKRPEQITVKQLIDRIAAEGLPTRLAWSEEQMNSQVPWDMEEWPTGIIPRVVVDEGEEKLGRAG